MRLSDTALCPFNRCNAAVAIKLFLCLIRATMYLGDCLVVVMLESWKVGRLKGWGVERVYCSIITLLGNGKLNRTMPPKPGGGFLTTECAEEARRMQRVLSRYHYRIY